MEMNTICCLPDRAQSRVEAFRVDLMGFRLVIFISTDVMCYLLSLGSLNKTVEMAKLCKYALAPHYIPHDHKPPL